MSGASKEQQEVVDLLSNYNVVVDSVAGSGKTTTNQFIATKFSSCKILLITYNSRLRQETKQKFESSKISNVQVHTYHSFCVKYYDKNCFTDEVMENIIKENTQSVLPFKFDIIILDEAQDITPRYYKLVKKICRDNIAKKNFKLCVMGDQKQCIYQFNESDNRFIKYADTLFSSLNEFDWKRATLSTSFRLTKELSSFLNNCVLNEERIQSQKSLGIKPRYLVCPPYNEQKAKLQFNELFLQAKNEIIKMNSQKDSSMMNENNQYVNQNLLDGLQKQQQNSQSLILEVFYYLCMGYKYEDIFILAPTLKSNDSPVKLLANDLSSYKIPICVVDSSDDSKAEDVVFQKKITFLTYHQSKGLQRKVVIVFNFDDSFNTFYNFNASELQKEECSNEHYVALTRSLEQLTIVHFDDCEFLPFIKKDQLGEYAESMGDLGDKQPSCHKSISRQTTPKQLTKHLPYHILQKAYSFLQVEICSQHLNHIEIPKITKQPFNTFDFKNEKFLDIDIHEMVNDINETTILGFYDIIFNNRCFLSEKINEFYRSDTNILKKFNISIDHTNKYNIITQEYNKLLEKPQIEDLLFLSNLWSGLKHQQVYRLNQISQYDWMSVDILKQSVNRIENIIGFDSKFQQLMEFNNSDLLKKYVLEIQAYVCCFKNEHIWEFKFTEKIQEDYHLIQFAIVKYCFLMMNKQTFINEKKDQLKKYTQLVKQSISEYFQNGQLAYFCKKNQQNTGCLKQCTISSLQQNGKVKINYKNKSKSISIDRLFDNNQRILINQIKQLEKDNYFKFKVMNIYDNITYEDKTNLENLEKMIEVLVEYRYGNKEKFDDDKSFIESMLKI